MYKLVNYVSIILISILNRLLLNTIRAKKQYQPIFEKLFLISIYGMNYGRHGGVKDSGEEYFVKRLPQMLKERLGKNDFLLIDVGAHKGEYSDMLTNYFNGINHRIHAFEPIKHVYNQMKYNLRNYKQITVHNFGLGNTDSQEKMVNPGSKASFICKYDNGINDYEEVQVSKLDSFCKTNKIEFIDFLKVDVEGFEYAVLKGAKEMLFHKKIYCIQFEFGYIHVLAQSGVYFKYYFDLLKENYDIFRIMKNGLLPIKEVSRINEVYFGANFVAILKTI